MKFLSLAFLFLFASCSVPERDSPFDPKGSNYQGGAPPSVGSNCSLNGSPVTICSQVWMSENLNCGVSGSYCYSDEYNINSTANCKEYGRLYDWAAAMALPVNCNFSSCESQIGTKHRGICPEGWHIPSDAEWDVLVSCAGGFSSAGAKLKSKSGWDFNHNGTDNFGFAALPGGKGSDGYGFGVLDYGYWWTATQSDDYNASFRKMSESSNQVYWGDTEKDEFLSVRCVKD